MPYTELARVSSTFNKSLRVIPSATAKKGSKVVVGDQSGTVTCFKWAKEMQLTFEQTKNEPITALTLDGDKIVVAYGQRIECIKKKGKVLSTFNLSLNEDITSLQAKGDTIWCGGEYVYNCYRAQRDSHFFMSSDIIHHLIVIDLGLDELCPVLGCKDKAIRVLNGSELLFEVETASNVTSLHEIDCREPTASESSKQIIYGLENGTIGQLLIDRDAVHRGWTLEDHGEGAVNCIASYDFTGDGFAEVIVARDNGTLDVFEWRAGSKPFVLASESLSESITGLDVGFVTGITAQDIVCAAYSGRVIAFHCDPSRDFSAWEEPSALNRFRASGLASPLKAQMDRISMLSAKQRVLQEVDEYRKEIALKKSKYQEKSKELIAVNTQFHLKHSLKLLESEAAYLVTLEIGIPIDLVAVQCSVDAVSLDVDKCFGLQTQHKNMENEADADGARDSGHCFVFHSSTDSVTRFTWKFRVAEGRQGVLTAFIASKRIPKTSQSVEFPIKALSLHSSVSEAEEEALSKRPTNTLRMDGDWSLRAFNSWLGRCVPDVPSRVTTEEVAMRWKSLFVGDYITATFRSGSAVFKSDSVTAIAILQEFLTKLAIEHNVAMTNVDIEVDIQSALHFFNLIRPKLEYHHRIHQQQSWIDALREIESHEEDTSILSDKMQDILKNSDRILAEFKTSPKHLQFIKNMIWCNIRNFAKLRNQTISKRDIEDFQRGLDSSDCDVLLAVIQNIMR